MAAQDQMKDFHLPRYREIPDVGLYLEQCIEFINSSLAPLGADISITPSMLSNYVKRGYIERPVRKRYHADQISYLMFITLAKRVLSMENIVGMFKLQQSTYGIEIAHDYFCNEFESHLKYLLETGDQPGAIEEDATFAKRTLRNVIIALTHIIYLDSCFTSDEFLEEIGQSQ